MLNKVLNYLTSTRKPSTKLVKNFVNIASDSNNINVSEELQILREAKGVIENFAKKNNIKVDLFFKESKTNKVNEQMVDVKVSDCVTNAFAKHTVVYKRNNEPIKFIFQKPHIRYVKAENQEYIQRIKSGPMEVTEYDTIKRKVLKHKVELSDIIIHIKQYNNYLVPQKVGEGIYEDSFLAHVYRVIERLNAQSKS